MTRICLIALLCLSACSAPAPQQEKKVDPPSAPVLQPPQETSLTVEQQRAWWKSARARMEAVIAKQGRTPVDIESPKWFEIGYSTLGRMPLVDTCLREPLVVPEVAMWADDETKKRSDSMEGLWQLASELATEHVSDATVAPPDAPEDIVGKIRSAEYLPDWAQDVACALLAGVAEANARLEKAFDELTLEEKRRIEELLPAYFVRRTPAGEAVTGYTTGTDECVELIMLLQEVDFAQLELAGAAMSVAIDRARAAAKDALIEVTDTGDEILLDLDTPYGRIVVGGPGPNIYREDYAILIDIGGDDVYLNHSASSSFDGPAAVVFDVVGSDKYIGGRFSQASAMCGVAALVDLAGDDIYKAEHYSQGAALCGYSFFYEGGGDDMYEANFGAQCFAMFGASLFVERSGRDSYRLGSMGQGAASTLGVAILAEGGGDDAYRAGGRQGFYENWDASCAQGAASGMRPWPTGISVWGGIGFLGDAAGNDTYDAYRIGQGGSYLMALGILVDSEGNDTYNRLCYCNGVGVHCSAGVCVDRAGDDVYNGLGWGNNGYDLDRSSGVFVDFCGNDVYRSNDAMGFGHKPKGTGVFFDARGNDTYLGTNDHNFGKADILFVDDAYPSAFFLDWGGKDFYAPEKFVNNREWAEGEFGFGEDAEIVKPFDPAQGKPDADGGGWWKPWPAASKAGSEAGAALARLSEVSPLCRLTALGLIEADMPKGLEVMCAAAGSPDRTVRRHLIDVFQGMWARGMLKPEHGRLLAPMLAAEDYDMRLLALHAMHRLRAVDADVVGGVAKLAADDPSYEVRSMACLVLGVSKREEALPVLSAALSDPHWRVRRRAAIGLAELAQPGSLDVLASALEKDSQWQVRGLAADALGKIGKPEAVPHLEKALGDPSEVVRFQAARALLLKFGRKDAMEALLALLAPWPSPILREQYLTNFLGSFTGQPLPFEPEPWRKWWEGVKATFDPAVYVAAIDKLDQAGKLRASGKQDEAIGLYREIRKAVPGHTGAGKELSDMLNGIAWNIVLSGRDYEKGLALAMESVEAAANSANIDTLAVLEFLTGHRADAARTLKQAIEKATPDERRQYETRLKEVEAGKVELR